MNNAINGGFPFTLASFTADIANNYASQGLLSKADLIEWCLIANKNHLSLDWSVVEHYHLRSGKKFAYWQVVSQPRLLTDEE